MNKKLISYMLALLMIFSLFSTISAAEPDYVLKTNSPTVGSERIELKLQNNSGDEITVAGPIDVKVTINGNDFPRESLDEAAGDTILDGGASMVIPGGETRVIAEIAPAMPGSWRPHDAADYDMDISAWAIIDGTDHHTNIAKHTVTPKDHPGYNLTLSTNGPVEYTEDQFSTTLILSLTNNSDETVTISGKAVVDGDGSGGNEYNLIGGGPIDIAPGQTAEVVEIEPGPPHMWNNFYFPQINHVKAWFNVNSASLDSMIWESETVNFCITGTNEGNMLAGTAGYLEDNEDGTATLRVELRETVQGWTITSEGGICYRNDIFEDLGPATGLTRNQFFTHKDLGMGGSELIGKVIRAEEIEPGVYLLTWSHIDGTHEIFVEVFCSDGMDNIIPAKSDWSQLTFKVIVSTQNRPIESKLNEETNKYEGVLKYPTATITFTSDQEINAEINYRRQGETTKAPPKGANPVGIYMEINVASGDLGDAQILLEVDYSRDDIPPGTNEKNLKLFRYNEDTEEWEVIPEQEVDTENKVIRAWLTGFSEFGVFEYDETADIDDEEDEEEDEDRGDLPETAGGMLPLYLLGYALTAGGAAIILRRKK